MFTYHGGNKVAKGTYWNLDTGLRVDVTDEDILPGDSKASYSKFSPGVMLLLGPIFGLLYFVALPFIAIATMITLVGKKLLLSASNLLGHVVSFGWRPSEAHLAGKKKTGKKENKNKGPDS